MYDHRWWIRGVELPSWRRIITVGNPCPGQSVQWTIHAGRSVGWTIRKWVKQPYTEFCSKMPRTVSNLPHFLRCPFQYVHLCFYTSSMYVKLMYYVLHTLSKDRNFFSISMNTIHRMHWYYTKNYSLQFEFIYEHYSRF